MARVQHRVPPSPKDMVWFVNLPFFWSVERTASHSFLKNSTHILHKGTSKHENEVSHLTHQVTCAWGKTFLKTSQMILIWYFMLMQGSFWAWLICQNSSMINLVKATQFFSSCDQGNDATELITPITDGIWRRGGGDLSSPGSFLHFKKIAVNFTVTYLQLEKFYPPPTQLHCVLGQLNWVGSNQLN